MGLPQGLVIIPTRAQGLCTNLGSVLAQHLLVVERQVQVVMDITVTCTVMQDHCCDQLVQCTP